ncbi:sulfotransferase [Rhodanobacter denitrificans]|uniref:Sulfotransferase family protein n=4 Tax=Rhodanobacter denitrificans TaxID=666685 RepID=M4NDP4_9GAMM|nr:tetratricopeptide repeat-containing sulfotransferase family protein [Rhodanobacter denitrificans]AGG87578.1 sulfotransferase family protein [Rhodanobacter denitrificans]UJJ59727.1 sulfotransferase [Rhodanobacter denitrificans]UJM86751.1 sulfotransferase [Rhodanobacter denitrificans]UJM90191.1 sulfotransferase [Rhodanobacter denitrificans]
MPTASTDLAGAMAGAWNAGEPERVIALAAQATPAQASDESVLLLLGLAQQATARLAQAVATFRRLAQRRPDVSAYWNNLAVVSRQAGDLAGAEQALLTALTLAPDDAELHYNLGLLHTQQRRWLPARQALLDAAQLDPHFIEARLQAAYACYVCGDNTRQEAMLSGAGDWPAQPAEQALVLSAMLSVQGNLDAALRTLAHAQLPDGAAAGGMRLRIAAQRVLLYERNNRIDAAQDELRQLPLAALDALPPDEQQARADGWRAHAALAMRSGAHAEADALYQRVLACAIDDESRASAAFGLASARDRQGRHPEAWQALQQAHAIQLDTARNVVPELLATDSRPLQVAGGNVARGTCADWKPLSSPGSRQSPVFVVGFPRSGTTLLEQMLDAHQDFRSMDERAYVHDLIEGMELVGQQYPEDLASLTQQDADQLRSVYRRMVGEVLPDLGGRRLVDKNPLNMLCLPMIMRLFPHARIILCLRHPCDVLLSCSMQPFRSPAFMVLCSSLQRLAQGYAGAFEQWYRDVEACAPQVLEWRYESVVDQFDAQVARLGQFLDIADTSPMTRFAEHARRKRFISTPSYAQVTEGVHRKAVGRWQHYREQFEPVLPLLRPWLDRFGYEA